MYEALVRPMLQQPADPDKLAAHTASFHRWAAVLDRALASADYLATGRFTCADIAVASALTYAPPARMPLDEHPPVRRLVRPDRRAAVVAGDPAVAVTARRTTALPL